LSQRILVVRQDPMGEVVLASALLSSIRQALPDAVIGCAVQEQYLELLRGHPAGIELQTTTAKLGHRAAVRQGLIWRRQKWDVILLPRENGRGHIYAAYVSGAPVRAGFCYHFHRVLLNRRHRVHLTERQHEAQIGLEIARLGLGVELEPSPLWMPEGPSVDHLGLPSEPFLLVAVGTGQTAPPWPAENWRKLLANAPGPVVLTGSEDQRELAEGLPGLNLVGRTSLLELGSLARRARLVVAANTGLIHVGAACITPSVVIETGRHDRYMAMRWKPWMTPSWHVLRPLEGGMPTVASAAEKLTEAWQMTATGADQQALAKLAR